MTREEFLAEYSGMKVAFKEYYKFHFTYVGVRGNKKITVTLGDEDGDIYRDYFKATETIDEFSLLGYNVETIDAISN